MAMIEVDIPTGFVVLKHTMKGNEVPSGLGHLWKRSRFTGQKSWLHLEYVSIYHQYCPVTVNLLSLNILSK